MKRVYAAAAALVVAGAGIGFLLRPAAPAQAETVSAEAPQETRHASQERYRDEGAGSSTHMGGAARKYLPPAVHSGGATAQRADCFFIRMGYHNASKPGADPLKKAQLRNAGLEGGCWMPESAD